MTLILRPLRADDEFEVRRLHEQLMSEDFALLLAAGSWDEILASIDAEAAGHNLPPDRVPADFLVAEVDGTVIGRVSIRHRLNPYLYAFGGHIGYAVGPAFRGRGYATEILHQAITRLTTLGVHQILVVCEADNLASARVIEKCGGVMEDVRVNDGTYFCRYWITSAEYGENR